jgi:hypothetical protein
MLWCRSQDFIVGPKQVILRYNLHASKSHIYDIILYIIASFYYYINFYVAV